jgi:hypothetical protein
MTTGFIISACDRHYYPLLMGLIDSLADNARWPGERIGLFDLGLSDDQRDHLRARGVSLVRPGWDITWPGMRGQPEEYRKYVTVAPFLPQYFPGREIYIWIDADAWCQDPQSLTLLIKGAQKGRMAIVPVTDRAYPSPLSGARVWTIPEAVPLIGGRRWRVKTLLSNVIARYYDRGTANRLMFKPVLSAGIYALPANAPHWRAWETSLRAARFRSPQQMSDQSPLNHAVYTRALPVELLPATVNWTCHAALPAFDPGSGLFVEPYLPHTPIGFMHLVNHSQQGAHEVATLDGGTARLRLTYQQREGAVFSRGKAAQVSAK